MSLSRDVITNDIRRNILALKTLRETSLNVLSNLNYLNRIPAAIAAYHARLELYENAYTNLLNATRVSEVNESHGSIPRHFVYSFEEQAQRSYFKSSLNLSRHFLDTRLKK